MAGRAGKIALSFQYDELGRVVKQVDANGHETNFQYDSLMRRPVAVTPGGSQGGKEYDSDWRVLRDTDAMGIALNIPMTVTLV